MGAFATDDRGVSEVIGAILVFGLVFLLIAIVQMQGVPAANKQVELKHSEEVEEDLGGLQGALSRTAGSGSGESVRIAVGLQYPNRFILMNPPPVSGSLSTDPPRNITFDNLSAIDGETADFLSTSPNNRLEFPTKTIRYEPSYNRLDDIGVSVFETGVRYKQFDETTNVQRRGLLVDGRQLTIVTINGSLSASGQSVQTLSTVPLSSSSGSVGVTRNETDKNVKIGIPTDLSQETWEEILDDQIDPNPGRANGRYVSSVKCSMSVNTTDSCPGRMLITMEEETGGTPVTYNLRMAKVGVGTDHTEANETYIVDVQGHKESTSENGSQKLIFEVRDRFNNPVSGVTVNASITQNASFRQDDSLSETQLVTDTDGQAEIVYFPPENVNRRQFAEVTVWFNHANHGAASDAEKAVFNVTVMNADGSGQAGVSPFILQFTASQQNNDIEVTWDVLDANDDLSLINISVFDENGDHVTFQRFTGVDSMRSQRTETISDPGITPGESHTVVLEAIDDQGNTAARAFPTNTVPPPPI